MTKTGDGSLDVAFTSGPVTVTGKAMSDLRHGWAITVHRAQGSEWPGVVVVVPPEAGGMLSRPLVYTALTRAQRHLSIVHASGAALARAVREVDVRPRRTRLAALLAETARLSLPLPSRATGTLPDALRAPASARPSAAPIPTGATATRGEGVGHGAQADGGVTSAGAGAARPLPEEDRAARRAGRRGAGARRVRRVHLDGPGLAAATPPAQPRGTARTYYIAADSVRWNYAPEGRNLITDAPFDDVAAVFTAAGPNRVGTTYRKSLYQEYTDATFSTLAARPAAWQHLGFLGPVIHAAVGDTVRIVFRNNLDRAASIHMHGLRYDKASEGAPYDDGTTPAQRADDAVPPGATYSYTYAVPERAGPGPMDASSVMWMYHSHVDEVGDTNSGLMGPVIVTARDMARADGTPKDVDRESSASSRSPTRTRASICRPTWRSWRSPRTRTTRSSSSPT